MDTQKQIIGRKDKADFPILEIKEIDIKVDTGAYTSSIHCEDMEEIGDTLRCSFLDATHPEYNGKKFSFSNYDITAVRSSNGKVEVRYSIRTKIILFDKTYPITLTLTSREDMRFPILLGRKFLNGKFLVDTELQDQSFNTHIVSNEH